VAELKNRIENGLNEARILLLGGQVLLGFAYRAYFEPRFEQLPHSAQLIQTISLCVLTATLGVLIWPAPFHQIAVRGEESARIDRFTSHVLDWALLPFAVGTGLGLYPVWVAMHAPHPEVFAIGAGLFALVVWYGLPALYSWDHRTQARDEAERPEREKKNNREDNLGERIKNVLIECRMALPGAQALLGFQFINVFTESFDKLPRSLQWIHFASLICTLITTVLLIAPAAFHRLAEAGEETERFHRVASRLLLTALAFLAPGLVGDIIVVFAKMSNSITLGVIVSATLLVSFYGLWFGYSRFARTRG
jgi:Family of unknown function (DUF6328)